VKFEIVGKTKATLADIDIQSLKRGQTEVVPAVALTFKVTMANHALAQLDKALLHFLYAKASAGAAGQATLEGVAVVSDMPALTPAAVKIGTIGWDDEQTGAKLTIYQGATGHGDIRLKDCTVKVKKLDPKEGGTVDFYLSVYTADVDAETLGDLGVLKSHDLDIELVGPEVAKSGKQKELEPPPAGKVTPIKPNKKGALGTDAEQAQRQADVLAQDKTQVVPVGAWPFPTPDKASPRTPEEALAAGAGK
jgi:hypothetical protein